jgi:L-threonylcarbamoyladenylate synthase
VSLRTQVIQVSYDAPDPAALGLAAEVVRGGGLVAFATETVYGLGADATNARAVARIFEAKGRPSYNPLIVHADRVEMAQSCVACWPDRAEELRERFWPGPLSLVLPRAPIIPDVVTAGRDTVCVRIPRPRVARDLIQRAGRPIAAPSANRSTGISPTEAWHVLNDLDGKIDLLLDSGPTGVGIESTVVDLSVDPPRVLRHGTITLEQLSEALGTEVLGLPRAPGTYAEEGHTSPGQMTIHYAPRTPAYRVDRDRFATFPEQPPARWGMLTIGPPPRWPRGQGPTWHARLRTPAQAEAYLYGYLHAMDMNHLDYLIIVPPPDEPCWRAVRDRLWRASTPWAERDEAAR